MAARRMVRRTSAVRGQRRKLVWATRSTTFASIGAGGSSNIDLLADFRASGASVLGCTVMRIHAHVYVGLAGSADNWGIGIVVGRLADVGTNRISLDGDPEVDWMIADRVFATFSGATNDSFRDYVIDLRSKRKSQE